MRLDEEEWCAKDLGSIHVIRAETVCVSVPAHV